MRLDFHAVHPDDETDESQETFKTEAQMSAIDFDNPAKRRINSFDRCGHNRRAAHHEVAGTAGIAATAPNNPGPKHGLLLNTVRDPPMASLEIEVTPTC